MIKLKSISTSPRYTSSVRYIDYMGIVRFKNPNYERDLIKGIKELSGYISYRLVKLKAKESND